MNQHSINSIISYYGRLSELNKWKSEPINEIDGSATMGTTGQNTNAPAGPNPSTLPVNPDTERADAFIKALSPEKRKSVEAAVRKLAFKYGKTEDKVGYYTINGQNMKIHFEPLNAGAEKASKAVFQFVENSNRATDLADEFERATAGWGTNENIVFAIPATLRAYCEKTGKNFFQERANFEKAYRDKYKKSLYNVAVDELEATNNINDRKIIASVFWLNDQGQVSNSGTGNYFAATVLNHAQISPTDNESVANLIENNHEENDVQRFCLTCSLGQLRAVNAILAKRGVELLKHISQEISGDLRLAFKYTFMAAGIVSSDSTYDSVYHLVSLGAGNKNFIVL